MALFGGISIPGHPDPENVRKLDLIPLPQIRRMQRMGMAVDLPWLQDLSYRLAARMEELRGEILDCVPVEALERFVGVSGDVIGINPESSVQIAELLYEELGLGVGVRIKRTKGGARLTTGKKTLEQLKKEHPVVPLILEYREASKLKGTYTDKMPRLAVWHEGQGARGKWQCGVCGRKHWEGHWRIHTSIMDTRTDTGRMACVAAWTPITVCRGEEVCVVPIKDVVIGDLVWTHKGRWRNITAKWLKGVEEMVNVTFSNGHTLTCTKSHRLLEYSHEHIEKMDKQPKKRSSGAEAVSTGRIPHSGNGSEAVRCDIPQRPACAEDSPSGGGVQGIAGNSLFPKQDGGVESDDGQDRGSTSRVYRRVPRWTRVSDLLERWETATCASSKNGGGPWIAGVAGGVGCASHRREWNEQPHGQLSTCDSARASTDSLLAGEGHGYVGIEKVEAAGSLEVYDISVEEDESYEACGVFSHNSKNPNLQNIPIRTKLGAEVRKAFYAPKGYRLVGADYSGIELRLLGHCAREENMIRIFRANGDIHTDTAMRAFGISDPKQVNKQLQRAPCKAVNFAIVYGLEPPNLLDLMALTYATANQPLPDWLDLAWCVLFMENWFALYPSVRAYLAAQHGRARRYGFVWTPMGRVRLVPEVRSTHERVVAAGLRQAGNMPIQGFAADIMRLGMGIVEHEWEQLRADGVEVEALMTIHDEILSEVEEDWADGLAVVQPELMKRALVDEETGVEQCLVQIEAEGKCMERWEK